MICGEERREDIYKRVYKYLYKVEDNEYIDYIETDRCNTIYKNLNYYMFRRKNRSSHKIDESLYNLISTTSECLKVDYRKIRSKANKIKEFCGDDRICLSRGEAKLEELLNKYYNISGNMKNAN